MARSVQTGYLRGCEYSRQRVILPLRGRSPSRTKSEVVCPGSYLRSQAQGHKGGHC